MSNINIKEKKAAKLAEEKKQDAKLYRLMVQFAFVVIAVLLVIKTRANQIFTLEHIMPPYLLVTWDFIRSGSNIIYRKKEK